jgi:hypothetical protein
MALMAPVIRKVGEHRRTRRPRPHAPQQVDDNRGGVATVPAPVQKVASGADRRPRRPSPQRPAVASDRGGDSAPAIWRGSWELDAGSGVAVPTDNMEGDMNSIIWLVGAVVIVLVILSFFGLR